jgi:hypothetical protein
MIFLAVDAHDVMDEVIGIAACGCANDFPQSWLDIQQVICNDRTHSLTHALPESVVFEQLDFRQNPLK